MSGTYFLVPLVGLISLAFALFYTKSIMKVAPGNKLMREIAGAINTGALVFLRRQYKTLIIFVVCMAVFISVIGLVSKGQDALNPTIAVAFVIGATCSIMAGNFGMRVATKANVRTANAAMESGMNKALKVAFAGGAVMGLCVVGLGLFGLGLVVIIFHGQSNIINGFSLGASSVALFGRVGGGIYTKAADVGADLVGKVEAHIDEDDPRNPAVIADNVGDNVGDVAGMGSDLFESYVGSVVAAIALGASFGIGPNGEGVLTPLMVALAGVLSSIAGTFFVKLKNNSNPQKALNRGTLVANILAVLSMFAMIKHFLPAQFTVTTFGHSQTYTSNGVFLATAAGLAVGFAIGKITEYYTSSAYTPVKNIAESSLMGAAPNIINGIAVGMNSTAIPVLLVSAGILIAYAFAGFYGIAMAAIGMLGTTGIVVAIDSYGPISDNAGGIAKMAGLPEEVRGITDKLDAVGNTTASIGKGFAIGSAALTALALFFAYVQAAHLDSINILSDKVVAGLFIGGMLPFFFSSLAMQAVGRAAAAMVEEVRRQFRDIPGLLAGDKKAKADYATCVDISTKAALKGMIMPSLLAVAAPLIVGLTPFLGKEALGGMLAGSLVTGFLLAIFMANAGGAWDNAKKYVEEGHLGGSGSDTHAATIIGDTVGDPFKDTAGPSLNILIKLMTIISLIFVPLFF